MLDIQALLDRKQSNPIFSLTRHKDVVLINFDKQMAIAKNLKSHYQRYLTTNPQDYYGLGRTGVQY